jgi:hypothetical protein
MRTYALLILPSANRVYGRHAMQLALAELEVVCPALNAAIGDTKAVTLGGVEYLSFDAEEIDHHDRVILSNLSAAYALFEVARGGAELRPLLVEPIAAFGSDLVTIQRYVGKTNEQFTHLLVNVARAVSPAASQRSEAGLTVRLLDPVAGRGATLNRGLMYGFDVAGIELDSADFDAYRTFLTTYLKDNRRPFKLEDATTRKGPLAGSKRFTVRIGKSQRVDFVRDDTVRGGEHFPARSFDLLVADLPYGVQHGSAAVGALARSPDELIFTSLAQWRKLLRSGSGIALAWNTKTLKRDELEVSLTGAGFAVVHTTHSFEHKVDRSITRDVVVART